MSKFFLLCIRMKIFFIVNRFFIRSAQYIPGRRILSLLRSLKKTNYSDPRIYNKMGFIYIKMRNYKMSYRCFNKATQLDPNKDIYWSNAGYSLRHLIPDNNTNEEYAKQAFDKAIEINPSNVISWLNRCYMEFISGDYKTALVYCNKAMELDNKYFIIYFNRGMIYLKDCKYELAIKDFNMFIKLSRFSFSYRKDRKSAKKELKALLIHHTVINQ